jgi:hypothetical protein
MVIGQSGISEAKAAKMLMYVAMCFAPLAWVAAVYSIPDGGRLFWKYWASALPATLAVWLFFWLWRWRMHVMVRNLDEEHNVQGL